MSRTLEDYKARQKKVVGVPRLPLAVDAAFDNKWGGNIMAYAYDPNPAIYDPVYTKLEEGFDMPLVLTVRDEPEEHVALYYRDSIRARQMDEVTYKQILRTPVNILRKEFSLKYRIDASFRERVDKNHAYKFSSDKREWTDS